MFDDEVKLLQFQDDERQVIYSVAMRPNMLIPRKDVNGEPAMVFYTEETIADLQQNFFKNNYHNGSTINHDGKLRNDMCIFESWIVSDPEKDKATSLGLFVKKGDWVTAQKIDNPEVWQDVKDGKLTGFSIEAYLEPVLINNQIEMTQEEIDERIKKVLMETEEEKKVADAKLAEEEAEKLKMEGEPPVPPKEDEPNVAELQKTIEEQATEINDLKAKLSEYEAKEVQMSAEIAATKKVALEMAEEMKKGIKPEPVAVAKKYEEMSNAEKLIFNQNKRK